MAPNITIPPLTDKVILITGANSGLGEAVLTALAKHSPSKIYLAARSQSRAEAALSRIQSAIASSYSDGGKQPDIEILPLDLSSLASVKSAAEIVLSSTDRLDILHLNGGVAAIPYATSTDGYELQFATNYLGHMLLVQLLLPLLLSTSKLPGADVRVVAISSMAHKIFAPKTGVRYSEIQTSMSSRTGMELYGQTNLARTLFAYEFAKRYPSITTTSVHPGVVKSNIWAGDKGSMNPFFKYVLFPAVTYLQGVDSDTGALTQLWCTVTDKNEIVNGAYYEPVGKRADGKLSRDDKMAEELWNWTGEELKKFGGPGWVAA